MACSIITFFSEVSSTPLTLKYLNVLLMCSKAKGVSREKDRALIIPCRKKSLIVTTLYTNNDRRKSFKCNYNVLVAGQNVWWHLQDMINFFISLSKWQNCKPLWLNQIVCVIDLFTCMLSINLLWSFLQYFNPLSCFQKLELSFKMLKCISWKQFLPLLPNCGISL